MHIFKSICSLLLFVVFLPLSLSVDPKWKTPIANKRNITSRSQRTETDPQGSYYSRLEDFKLPDYRSRAGANSHNIPPSNNLPRHHVPPMVPPEFLGRPGFNRIPNGIKSPGGLVTPSEASNVPSNGIVFYPTNGIPPFMYNPANNTFVAVPGVAWTPWNGQLVPYLAGASSIPPQGQYGPTEPSASTRQNFPTNVYSEGAGYSPSATPEGFTPDDLTTYSSTNNGFTSQHPTSLQGSSSSTSSTLGRSTEPEEITDSYNFPSVTTEHHLEVEPATKNYENPDDFYTKTTYGESSELTSPEGYPTLVHTSSSHADITPSGYTESHVSSNPTRNRPTDHPVYPGEHDQFEIPDLNEDYSPHTIETIQNGRGTTSPTSYATPEKKVEEETETPEHFTEQNRPKETEDLNPVPAQTYQPPSNEKSNDILTNLNVKLVRPICTGGSCGEKISVYTPPKGPKLLISSAAKGGVPPGVSSRRPSSNFHPTKLPMPTVMERKFLPFVPADEQLQFGVNTRGPHVFMQPHEFPEPTNTMRETSFHPTTTPYNPTYKPVPNSYKTTESPLQEETTADTSDSTEYDDEYTQESEENTPGYLEGSSKFTTISPPTNNQYETTDGYSPTYKPLYPEHIETTTVPYASNTIPPYVNPTVGAPGQTPLNHAESNINLSSPRPNSSKKTSQEIPNSYPEQSNFPEDPSTEPPSIPRVRNNFPEGGSITPNSKNPVTPIINAPDIPPISLKSEHPNQPENEKPVSPSLNHPNLPNRVPDRNPFGLGSETPNRPTPEVPGSYPERPNSNIPERPPISPGSQNPNQPPSGSEFPNENNPNGEVPGRTPFNPGSGNNAPGRPTLPPRLGQPNQPDENREPFGPSSNNPNEPNNNIPNRNPFGPGSETPNRPSQEVPGSYPERPNSNIPERSPFGPGSQNPNQPPSGSEFPNGNNPNGEVPGSTPFNPDSGNNAPGRPRLPPRLGQPNQPDENREPFGPSSNNPNVPNNNIPSRNPFGPGSETPKRPSQEIPGSYPERPNSNIPERPPFGPGSQNPNQPPSGLEFPNGNNPNGEVPGRTPFNPDSGNNAPGRPTIPPRLGQPNQLDKNREPFGPSSNNPNVPNNNIPSKHPFGPGSETPNRPSQEVPGSHPERPNLNIPGKPPFGPGSQSPNQPSLSSEFPNGNNPNGEVPGRTPFNPESGVHAPGRPTLPPGLAQPNQPDENREPFGPSSNNPNVPNNNIPNRNPFGPGSETPNRPSQEVPGSYPERPNSNIPERSPFGPGSQNPNQPPSGSEFPNGNNPNGEVPGRTPFNPETGVHAPGRPTLPPGLGKPNQPDENREPFGPSSNNPNVPNNNIPNRNPLGPGSETPNRPSQEVPGSYPERPNSNIPGRPPFGPSSESPNQPSQEHPGGRTAVPPSTDIEKPNNHFSPEIPQRPGSIKSELPDNPNTPPIFPNSRNQSNPNERDKEPTEKYPLGPNEQGPTRVPNNPLESPQTTTPRTFSENQPPGQPPRVTVPSPSPETNIVVSTTLLPPRNSTNYYSEQEETVPLSYQRVTGPPPVVANRVRGKTRIVCKEDGLEFGASTIFPFTGVIFAKDRKRIAACTKNYTNEENPIIFLPFSECGVRNAGEQSQRTQYHMQVVVVVEQTDGSSSIQSYMAQCVHQKINKNKQALPKRIDEALEELRLVPIKLEQQAVVPSVDMQILVDQGHDGLGPEVAEVDIGMPLVIRWKLTPASHSYGFHVKNCFVEDSISGTQMMLIDDVGCSSDATILSHPHYDMGHDTATSKMWAFKVPDHMKLKLHCDIVICSEITVPGNYSSCARIPTPPFCPDVITSPPNSILYDAEGGFRKRRRETIELSETQTVRAALCLGDNCEIPQEEMFVCFNLHILIASTALCFSLFVTSIILHLAMRKKRQTKV